MLLGATAAALLAVVTAFASGFGGKLADLIGSGDPPLISYSVFEQPSQCIGGEYVPRAALPKILEAPYDGDWSRIEDQPGAAALDRDDVQVAVQGGSARTITLTGISFSVKRRPRPPGVTFSGQCGGPFVGRAMEVDLDSEPPQIVDSVAEQDGMLGSRGLHGERLYKPIRFPWTVSATDPLLLDVVATTQSCYCEWSAEIPWVSGSSRGVIAVGDSSAPFSVTTGAGLPAYVPSPSGWLAYGPQK